MENKQLTTSEKINDVKWALRCLYNDASSGFNVSLHDTITDGIDEILPEGKQSIDGWITWSDSEWHIVYDLLAAKKVI